MSTTITLDNSQSAALADITLSTAGANRLLIAVCMSGTGSFGPAPGAPGDGGVGLVWTQQYVSTGTAGQTAVFTAPAPTQLTGVTIAASGTTYITIIDAVYLTAGASAVPTISVVNHTGQSTTTSTITTLYANDQVIAYCSAYSYYAQFWSSGTGYTQTNGIYSNSSGQCGIVGQLANASNLTPGAVSIPFSNGGAPAANIITSLALNAPPTPTAPAAPTGFTLSTTTISGTAPNPLDSTNSSTGYSVEYSTNGGSTWNVLTSTITAGIGNLTAGAAWSTGAIFTAGQSNIKLRYNAWNAVGNTEGTATAAQTMVDPAPVNLRVSGSTPTAVGLAWDADGGATGYNVKRRPTGSGSYSTVAGGGNVAGTTFSDTSVTPGVVYDYIVTALDGGGESAGSNVVTTGTAPDTPLAPTFGRIAQFQLVVVTPASFVSGALTYALQYANHGVNNWITFVSGLTAGAANTTVTGLASNTNYDFRFVATGASGTANGTVGSTYTERQIGMANPTVLWSQVGCQSLMIYPWANGAGPYNNTTGVTVQGIQGFTVGQEVKTAKLYGGESKYLLKSAQVQEDLTLKFGGGIVNLEVWKLLLGGQLGVDPGSLSFQEVQYYTQSLIGDRGGYVRIVATSTNGDGTLIMVYPKCMVTSLNYDLKTDTVTILDMAADPNWDYTYVTQLGTVGAIYDAYWGQGNQTAPVS